MVNRRWRARIVLLTCALLAIGSITPAAAAAMF
jgi:hypothetical protein